MASGSLMVFTGNANPKLAADVVRRLGKGFVRLRFLFPPGPPMVNENIVLPYIRGETHSPWRKTSPWLHMEQSEGKKSDKSD